MIDTPCYPGVWKLACSRCGRATDELFLLYIFTSTSLLIEDAVHMYV